MMRNYQKFPVEKWVDLLKGEPAFILGNSPSILKHDLGLISNYFTIGINRIYLLMEPTVLFWQDIGLYEDGGDKHVEACNSIKLCRIQCDKSRQYNNFEVTSGKYRFTGRPNKHQGSGCSAAIACQLAHAMGASHIVLLGCDGKYAEDGRTDFYGKNTQHRRHTVRNFDKGYDFLKRECPVPIINCSENERWPQVSLKDAIEATKPVERAIGQWFAKLC